MGEVRGPSDISIAAGPGLSRVVVNISTELEELLVESGMADIMREGNISSRLETLRDLLPSLTVNSISGGDGDSIKFRVERINSSI